MVRFDPIRQRSVKIWQDSVIHVKMRWKIQAPKTRMIKKMTTKWVKVIKCKVSISHDFNQKIHSTFTIPRHTAADGGEHVNKPTKKKTIAKCHLLLRFQRCCFCDIRNLHGSQLILFSFSRNQVGSIAFTLHIEHVFFHKNLIQYNGPSEQLAGVAVRWGHRSSQSSWGRRWALASPS